MPHELKLTNSSLRPREGKLMLRLMQSNCHRVTIGAKDGLTRSSAPATGEEMTEFAGFLATPPSADLTVMSFHPAIVASEPLIGQYTAPQEGMRPHFVGLANLVDDFNLSYIAYDGKVQHKPQKLSPASEDGDAGAKVGNELLIFEGDGDSVTWAVLNCHEYTHVDILRQVQEYRIELLVVVTYNTASRLYWQYALTDVHRLFCFVIIANVGELGGSGVFAPFRRIGDDKAASLHTGGQLFGAKGSAAVDVHIALELDCLRALRASYAEGFPKKGVRDGRDVILPSQRYLKTHDVEPGAVEAHVVTVGAAWNSSKPVVAFCQLESLSMDAYLRTGYQLDKATEEVRLLKRRLRARLAELKERCLARPKPLKLDFLVFPEVFVPRSFVDELSDFARENGTIVIAGVDYADGTPANECLVIFPGAAPHAYRKMTRSQYDAQGPTGAETRMPMARGGTLTRYENDAGASFGVLICYDYSHLELIEQFNLGTDEKPEQPLDLLFIVSHNPFGDLYRSCCIADSHRFYQHIVMCNVADYGGSGIFAPTRNTGARQVICELGQGVEAVGLAQLDLHGQRKARALPAGTLQGSAFMRKPGALEGRLRFPKNKV